MYDKLTIKAVGDIAAGDNTVDGLGICSLTKKNGSEYPFQKLGGILKTTDIVLGNLEGPLSSRCQTQSLRLCGIPGIANTLKEVGVDVLSVANNHIFDHGLEIFVETLTHCKEAGIELCGIRGKSGYYSDPVIIKKHSLTIGVLAYNWVGLEEADGEVSQYIAVVNDGVVNYTWNRDRAKDIESREMLLDKNKDVFSDISKLRNEVDIIIMMPHWGFEWCNYPPYGVVVEAHSFIDAGVDIIIGSHPHVIQGIEKYNNGIIAYSLGNFLFDFSTAKFVSGMVLELELFKGKIKNYKPTFITWNEVYQPEVALGALNDKYLKIVERSTKVITSIDPEKRLDDDVIYKEYEKGYNKLKLYKVIFLVKKLPKNIFLIVPIIGKFISFVEIMILRLKGKKVRW